jgi:xanthine dehydrogenase large subunit
MSGDIDLLLQGSALFTADIPLPAGALHGAVAVSPVAHAEFSAVDITGAAGAHVLTACDIPGRNQIGTLVPDEPLLADGVVHCVGQPFALVLAESESAARRAARRVRADFTELPAVLDARTAYAAGQLVAGPRIFACGDVDRAWASCATIVAGRVDLGSADHVALETHCALAVPRDDGGLSVYCATQSVSAVQRAIAAVTAIPMHLIEVQCARLGGGFGGKEDQATGWAALAALAAVLTGRPVRIVLDRHDDLRITGKRHPCTADYRLGLDEAGRFIAYEAVLLQDAGWATDLSPAILERSLFHACNAYAIANVRITAASCRTNLPSNTAFRGFGAPQGIAVIEAAIRHAARMRSVPAMALQELNLLREGDVTHYGMRLDDVRVGECWRELFARYDPPALARAAEEANAARPLQRRAVEVIPLCFGIAFTARALNQAEALVHVYADGTVSVTTGAVEMGQGVHAKIRAAAAQEFGIPTELITVEPTNTTRVANVSPTAASTGADLNGAVAISACRVIAAGLDKVDPDHELAWEERVARALQERMGLSALGHYATPGLAFDPGRETGRAFGYHVYGAAVVESTVDVLRGTASIDRVAVVHDIGSSIDPLIDLGQIEGALVQGVGWMTSEEILHDGSGRLLTDSLASYKIPDLASAPPVEVHLLQRSSPGLLGSKAVGEPPLIYGLAALFAIRAAIEAYRPDLPPHVVAPMTPQRIFGLLHGGADG